MRSWMATLACASMLLLGACDATTPEQSFGRAVLGSNLLYGFAGDAMQSQLASPGVKLVDAKTGATAPMKPGEVLDARLQAIESSYAKVKSLKRSDDAQDMIDAAVRLYEFTLPVFRNEYRQLAGLYDVGAPAGAIHELELQIAVRYGATFQQLHRALIEAGKGYAARHGIRVREVNPSPGR